MYRAPPEQAKYIQEVKWQKTLWEEGHGLDFPEKEKGEGEEESLETIMGSRMNRRGSPPRSKASDQSERPLCSGVKNDMKQGGSPFLLVSFPPLRNV